jgi:hypothetical protein
LQKKKVVKEAAEDIQVTEAVVATTTSELKSSKKKRGQKWQWRLQLRRWSKRRRRRRRRKRRCLRIRCEMYAIPVHEGMDDLRTLGLLGHSDFQQNM